MLRAVTFSIISYWLSGGVSGHFWDRGRVGGLEEGSLAVLTDTTDCYSEPGVEVAIFDEDVGGVCLYRDGIIAVIDRPATERDVIRVDRIRTISLKVSLV